MTGVKTIRLSLFARLALEAVAFARARRVAGAVSASSDRQTITREHEAIADELSAASAVPLQLQDGKAPEWITLIPPGTFSLIDGRGPFHNFNADAVVSASLARTGQVDLPGDYDHHMDQPASAGVKGIASGWIKELKAEQGAVKARVDWTSAARQHIENREYRYVSPRFAFDGGNNVLALIRFGLTNKPAITDLPAIAAAATHTPSKEPNVNLLQRLIGALAISASATEDQVVDLVRTLLEKSNAITKAAGVTSAAAADDVIAALRKLDASQYVSAADHQLVVAERDKLKKEAADAKTAQLTAEISAAVDEGMKSGQIVPASKQFWIDTCTSAASVNPVKTFLKTAPVVTRPGASQTPAGQAPAGGELSAAAVEADPDMMAICRQCGITPEAFAKTRNAELKAAADRAAQR